MRIIGGNEIQKMIYDRDMMRKEFLDKEKELTEIFENNLYQLKHKVKRYAYLWLYTILGYIFILLLLYKEFDRGIVKYGSIIVGLIIFLLGIYPIILLLKKNKLKSLWEQKEKDLLPLKMKANDLNEGIAKLTLAVICLTENIIELQEINNIPKLQKRWLVLLGQYRDGINLLHHNKATVEDYLNYYRLWAEEKAK